MTHAPAPADPETTCSALAAGTSLAGTAPTTSRWVLVEHDGPWGRHAVRDASPRWLAACAQLPTSTARTLLIRPHIHRISDSFRSTASRRIYTFSPGQSTVWTRIVPGEGETDHDQISDSIIESITQGPEHPAWQPASHFPRALVCTNGRRDRCCAQHGRALLDQLPHELALDVWECTHIGGHRFAPTGLAIPSGNVLGRLTLDVLVQLLTRDSIDLDHLRGRSDLTAAQQVAEIHARRVWGLESAHCTLHVSETRDMTSDLRSRVSIIGEGNAPLHVEVEGVSDANVIASCQSEPTPSTHWHVRA